jgi:hypothetical protein
LQDRLAAELRPRLRRSTLAAGSAPPQRSSGFAARVVQRALDITSAPEVHRPALVAELRDRPNEFDIQVQLCRDLDRMLVEDVTIEWPEALSPFVTVAKLRIPQQDISDADNLEKMDALSFTGWRVTAEPAPRQHHAATEGSCALV